MDDPSITINSEELSASLQINCDLAASTSLTSASSTLSTPYATPKNDRTRNGGGIIISSSSSSSNSNNSDSNAWIAYYEVLKRTPPKAARTGTTAQFHDTLATANKLLELSGESDVRSKPFRDLTHDQQAILVLMILKGMDKIIAGGQQKTAKVLINALRPESMEYKRLSSFVRKGGDCRASVQTLLLNKVSEKLTTFTRQEQKAITIFKDRPNMRPFLHLLREDSYICAYNTCSALLYYCSHNNQGENDDDNTIEIIKMNISKYVRDEVSGSEIANFTLTTVKGAYLERVLLGLLKSFGTTDCQNAENIPIWDDERTNFVFFKIYLEHCRPFVFGIECSPSLCNKERVKYTGKVANYYDDYERPDPEDRCYHALLCIGITPRNGSVPPMLLVQDSCPIRPVFEIGLDLLMDLGLTNSTPCTVPKEWTFNKNMDYTVSSDVRALFCGSPMSVDDQGVPRIINTKKPTKVPREDMSRYLDVVIAKPGEVLAFMT